MIGTGVFTSLGFQLESLRSGFALLMLWVVGGVAAVCGALTYAELGSTIRRSGGEYTFLSHIYHPAAGFVSGWISATIGFAAPTALAAITFGTYLSSVFPVLPARWLAVALVVLLSVVHGRTHRTSGGFQRWSTTAKVALILAFVAAGLSLISEPREVGVLPSADGVSSVFSAGFAVSLIFVSYSYSGWNAATYVTGELRDPRRTLPRALATGTLLVMGLYLGLNYVFLRAAPVEEMVGRLEVGYIAAGYIFGPVGADLMGITLALLLVSTVSAMVLAGPRVLHAIGEDYPTFRFLKFHQRARDARRGHLHAGRDQPVVHPHGIVRDDPRLFGLHDGPQHVSGGGRGLPPAPAAGVGPDSRPGHGQPGRGRPGGRSRRIGCRRTVPDLGLPLDAAHLPGGDGLDAGLHPARPAA